MDGLKRITIAEAVERIDLHRANTIPREEKVAWLNELDRAAWVEIFTTHMGLPPESRFDGYDQDTDPGTLLLIPEPYADVYKHWMASKIAQVTGESGKYAQDAALYNAAYQAFGDAWRRTHMPIKRRKYIRF